MCLLEPGMTYTPRSWRGVDPRCQDSVVLVLPNGVMPNVFTGFPNCRPAELVLIDLNDVLTKRTFLTLGATRFGRKVLVP